MGFARKYEGSRLGLALAKRYADIVGSEIQVSSKLREGSTYTLEIHQPDYEFTSKDDV
jgi:signal transduction histidine kinase